MPLSINHQIDTIKSVLMNHEDIQQVILFGSHVYGNPSKDSDIDLCIIANLRNKRKIEFTQEVRRILISSISEPMDILVYSKEEFTERADHPNSLEHRILIEGKNVYEPC